MNGFVNVAITSLERRFDLKSTQSGFIASSYDMGSLLAVVPISYFGGLTGTSKPRYVCTNLMLSTACQLNEIKVNKKHFLFSTYYFSDILLLVFFAWELVL